MTNYLFFMDIDGTLLRGNSGIHQKVLDSAKDFRDAGGDLVLCTGRAPVSVEWIVKKMEITLPGILYSGASLYDFNTNKHIMTSHMDSSVLNAIKQVMDAFPQVSIQAYTLENIYLLRTNRLLSTRGIPEEIAPNLSSLSDVRGEILKLVITCEDPQILHNCGRSFFKEPEYHFAFSGRRFAEVVSGGVSKANMMMELLARMDIPLSHTFAAGDAMTDYSMMKDSSYSFAPIDANLKILEICDEKIPVCEEGGVAVALSSARRIIESH